MANADSTAQSPESTPIEKPARAKRRPPENVIREVRRREREPEMPSAARATASERPDSPRRAAQSAERQLSNAMPPAVAERYVKVGDRYYFPDGAIAFTDRGERLTTRSENSTLISTLIDIARTRAWSEIEVRGTKRFREEAWRMGQEAGLVVRGYRPSEFERAQLAQRLAEGRPRPEPLDRERDRREAAPPEAPAAPRPAPTGPTISGTLVEHGRAQYKHDPKEAMSYFVKLRTTKGEQTIWGVDLERALRESVTRPAAGDEVTLRAVRRDAVTVKRAERDGAGETVGTQEIPARRNRWAVEKSAFFVDRDLAAATVRDPSRDPQRVSRDKPELVGTYLYLRGAEEIARREMKHPDDRARFMSIVREALASRIELGEPLPVVRLRGRGRSDTRYRDEERVR